MGKTKRHEPKHGQFKMLRSDRKKRTKNRRESKATLTKYVGLTNRKPEWEDNGGGEAEQQQ